MKKLNSKTTPILLFSVLGISFISVAVYAVMEENQFIKSSFRKKVERIERIYSATPYSMNMDCMYYTDGTYKCFSCYSVIDENDTLKNIPLTNFIAPRDSVVKYENETVLRVVRE